MWPILSIWWWPRDSPGARRKTTETPHMPIVDSCLPQSPAVLLVSVPFAPLGSPSLGLSLLQACLRASGVETQVWHLGLDFAAEAGVSEYRLVADELAFTPDLTGDWIFADALQGVSSDPEAWFAAILEGGHPAHQKPWKLRPRDPAGARTR